MQASRKCTFAPLAGTKAPDPYAAFGREASPQSQSDVMEGKAERLWSGKRNLKNHQANQRKIGRRLTTVLNEWLTAEVNFVIALRIFRAPFTTVSPTFDPAI